VRTVVGHVSRLMMMVITEQVTNAHIALQKGCASSLG
jgi:hypothetical protein